MATMTDDELFGTAPTPEVDDLADILPGLAPRFRVDSADAATWVVDLFNTNDEKQARLRAQYEAMMAALKNERERLQGRFILELEAWFDAQDKGKAKSLKLLTGTLAKRTVPGKPAALAVVDPAAALGWAATQYPGAVRQVPTLDPATLVAYVRETGEAVPGVELLPGRPEYESFSVKGAK